AGEDHRVVTDNGAAPQRRKADVAPPARPGVAVPRSYARCLEIDAASLGRCGTEHQSRARRGVHLLAVMHLDDLDVEVRVERFCNAPRDGGQQVDAEAHVARLDDGSVAGGSLYCGLVAFAETCCSDDMHDACVGGEAGDVDGRGGDGEVDDGVAPRDELKGIGGHGEAERRKAGKDAEVGTDMEG